MLGNKIIPLFFLLFTSISSFSQDDFYNIEKRKTIFRNEYSGALEMHTAGFSLGFRSSKYLAWNKKRTLAFNICTIKHPKEYKFALENQKNIIYGKLNDFLTLRTGIGYDKIINEKPIWGGVEVKRIFLLGLSLGVTKPMYIYVDVADNIEKYNPEEHDQHNIIGKASFTKGINEVGFYPGLYGKFGFGFDFGTFEERVKSFEFGAMLDIYLRKVPIMAYNKSSNYFFNLYVSYHFGKKTNNY